jgi:hypothetical protein
MMEVTVSPSVIDSRYSPKCELNDGSKTLVARDNSRSKSGIIGIQPRSAHFEILPGFEDLVDILLITYIYVEHVRKERHTEGAPYYVARAINWMIT